MNSSGCDTCGREGCCGDCDWVGPPETSNGNSDDSSDDVDDEDE